MTVVLRYHLFLRKENRALFYQFVTVFVVTGQFISH